MSAGSLIRDCEVNTKGVLVLKLFQEVMSLVSLNLCCYRMISFIVVGLGRMHQSSIKLTLCTVYDVQSYI